ncbi:MAG: hypoxanthine phosphoribosyltransferase [Bacteroidales bacterium]|jgi:hypoxanthine phosphoribosyltransferase|nr:hypoxanthine phosphoribosyltransferase [Bacteroidales bacterium]
MSDIKKKLKIKDKEFEVFIREADIQRAIKEVAAKINNDLAGKNPLFLIVLNGAFMFAADLMKHVDIECQLSFVKLSSYSGTSTTQVIRELIGLDEPLVDRYVVLVEDIVDTGHTMAHLLETLKGLGAKEVKIATLAFKPDAFKYNYPLDYIGMNISNNFVVGYGFDYDGFGRNSVDIYKTV